MPNRKKLKIVKNSLNGINHESKANEPKKKDCPTNDKRIQALSTNDCDKAEPGTGTVETVAERVKVSPKGNNHESKVKEPTMNDCLPNEGVQELSTNDCNQAETKIYAVGAVLKRRFVGKKHWYYIQWKGYPSKYNTWEPSEHVGQLDLVKLFDQEKESIAKGESKSTSGKKDPTRSYFGAIGKIWEVEEVTDKRYKSGEIEYELKWVGLDECYNSWEPRDRVKKSEAVKRYEAEEKSRLEEKERTRLFHKLGKQENDHCKITPKKIYKKQVLKESPTTRKYYDCITFNPVTDTSVNPNYNWVKEMWRRKMDAEEELDEDQKQFALMWNYFMTENREIYRGFCHMKPALKKFVEENKELLNKKLKSPYISHIAIMKDLGILDRKEAMECIMAI